MLRRKIAQLAGVAGAQQYNVKDFLQKAYFKVDFSPHHFAFGLGSLRLS